MNTNTQWNFEPDSKNMALMIVSLCMNMLAQFLTTHFHWPIILNCLGTCLTATCLGPLAGMLLGGFYGVVLAFINPSNLFYSIPHCVLGLLVGLTFPKNLSDKFQLAIAVAVSILASTLLNSPVDLILHDGYTTNYWGDALIDMICQNDTLRVFATFAGEALVNIPDKIITLLIVYGIVYLKHKLTSDSTNTLEE